MDTHLRNVHNLDLDSYEETRQNLNHLMTLIHQYQARTNSGFDLGGGEKYSKKG